MTNFMDTFNRLSEDAQHAAFKARNSAIIDYHIKTGAISSQRVAAIRFVVTQALGR